MRMMATCTQREVYACSTVLHQQGECGSVSCAGGRKEETLTNKRCGNLAVISFLFRNHNFPVVARAKLEAVLNV